MSHSMRLLLQTSRQVAASQLRVGASSGCMSGSYSAGSWVAAAPTRAFGSHLRGGVVAMGHGSHGSDNNPDTLLHEKTRNMEGKTPEVVPGAPGWNPQLASDSEAAVKAERMAEDMSVEQLQEHTVAMVSALHDTPMEQADTHPSVPRPMDAPALKDNMDYSQKQQKEDKPHNPL